MNPTDDDETRVSDAAGDDFFARILAGENVHAVAADVPPEARRAAEALRGAYDVFGAAKPAREALRPAADPRRFGRFELLDELGRGGQGSVFRAKDVSTGEIVALKFLDQRARLSASAVARLRREQAVLERLDHPHVARIRDAGVEDETPWIAMDLIDGLPLARWITERRTRGFHGPIADVRAAFAFFEKAARAVHVAHEIGVLHRDIKPGNIMVRPDGTPVILDFGLADDIDGQTTRVTQTGDLLGTPAYLAPEQLTRQAIRADRRTDVWGLGVTFYEALTGKPAFEAPTRERLYAAILAQEPVAPQKIEPRIPKVAAVCIQTALAKDRDRRYADMAAFADDLARLADDRPILARPERWPIATARWIARHPAVSLVIFLSVVLVALSGYLAARWTDIELGRTAERRERLSARVAEGYLALGEISIAAAREIFDDCIAIDSGAAEAWAGRILAEARFHDGAFRASTAAEKENGRRLLAAARRACGDAPALRPLARYFDRDRVVDDVGALIEEFRRSDAPDAMELFTAGVLLLQVGHAGAPAAFDAATDVLLTAALRVEGDSAMIDYQLTHAAAHARRKDIATRMRAILPARYPRSPTAIYWAGFAALADDAPLAARMFERAIEIDPNFLRARLDVVHALSTAGRPTEALAAAKTLVARFPENAAALATLSASLHASGDVAAAEDAADRALKIDPGERAALVVKGRSLLDKRDFVGARRALDHALTVWPNDVGCLRLRASVAAFQGDVVAAETDLRRSIDLAPEQLEPQMALAELYLNTRRESEAKTLIDAIARVRPAEPRLHQLRGNIAVAEQRFADAARELAAAVQAFPNDPECRRQYANVLAVCGETEAAARALAPLDSNVPANRWASGLVLYWSGDVVRAIAALEEAAQTGAATPGFPGAAVARIAECKAKLAEIEPLLRAIADPAGARIDTAVVAAGSAYAGRLFRVAEGGLRRLADAGRIEIGRADDVSVHYIRAAIATAAAKADAAVDLPGARAMLMRAIDAFDTFVNRIAAAIEDDRIGPQRVAVYVEVFAKDPFLASVLGAPDATFPGADRAKLAGLVRKLGELADD